MKNGVMKKLSKLLLIVKVWVNKKFLFKNNKNI